MPLDLSSDAFDPGATIPERFTCDGADVSPPLRIAGRPAGTAGLALVVDDPDAPAATWVHWVLWGIGPAVEELPAGIPADERVLDGALQGMNDFGNLGYGGPCPPPDGPHRYVFTLYALSAVPELEPGAGKAELLAAIEASVMERAELVGRYRRS